MRCPVLANRGKNARRTWRGRARNAQRTYVCGRPLTEADNGRFNVTHMERDRHRFKVPTLRNVALTAPYLHDGSRATLSEAVLVMGRYQLGRELDAEQVRVV